MAKAGILVLTAPTGRVLGSNRGREPKSLLGLSLSRAEEKNEW